MSEDYMQRRLPTGWNVFIEKSKLKSDINILNVSSFINFIGNLKNRNIISRYL